MVPLRFSVCDTIFCIYAHTGVFEQKPIGLISLLDEVSNLPKATDLIFAAKLKQQLSTNRCFKGERGGTFNVHHYAGEVSLLVLCGNLCSQSKY